MNKGIIEQLSEIRAKGQLQDIDLELCCFLQEREEKVADSVLLAACLVSYLYRQGDVCLALQQYAGKSLFGEADRDITIPAPELDPWKSELSQSTVVGRPDSFKPLILDQKGRLYLHKFWHYEKNLANQLISRAKTREPAVDIPRLRSGLDRLFNGESEGESGDIDWQRVAAAMAVFNKLSIISGGPGTGKTSTVVRILTLLLEQHPEGNETPDIALTAPTGKAAARLKDSISAAKKVLNVDQQVLDAIPDEAMTLHQLLGARRHTSSFRHDAENPVPYDVVIVDEASMVDQALMSKLMQALLTDARIILLGDKDQLASVEAGSVLGDICAVDQNQYSAETARKVADLGMELPESGIIEDPHPLTDNITLLTKSYRFGAESGIAHLSSVVNEGNTDGALKILHDKNYPDVSLIDPDPKLSLEEIIREKTESYFRDILSAGSVAQALEVFNQFRILAAHRRGTWGVEHLNKVVENVLQKRGLIPKYQRWYPGKPIIINVNDYSLGLHNGDTGICLPDDRGELKIYFPEEGSHRALAPGRLPDHTSAFALTVHKSQGSEFDSVFLILPAKPSKVLSRELVYTAITRARTDIAILSTETVLTQAVAAQMERSSGLRDQLWMK